MFRHPIFTLTRFRAGWEEGIVGMQVGGERRLVLPPAMAYGKKGTDGIPANSTLIFGTPSAYHRIDNS